MKPLHIVCCLFVLLLSLAAFAFLAAHPVAAQQLTPPPLVGSTCQPTGNGTICHGTTTFGFTAFGVSCGNFQIIQSATVISKFTLFYNQAGNATRWVFHSNPTGTFSNSVSGKFVPFTGHLTQTFTFVTPGDFSTVTITTTGLEDKVTLPGKGLILHDAGKVVISHGEVIFKSGPLSQEQQLCPVLS